MMRLSHGYTFRWVYYDAKPLVRWIFAQTFAPWLRLKLYFHGINRHSIGEVSEMTFKDLKAISDIMMTATGSDDKKKYLFDTEKPTSYDCALFGHLAQVRHKCYRFIFMGFSGYNIFFWDIWYLSKPCSFLIATSNQAFNITAL